MSTQDDLQRLLDEKAIADVQVAYCRALDTRDFEALRDVFMPYGSARYGDQDFDGVEEVMAKCSQALSHLDGSQHLVGNHEARIDGDRATASCYLQAQHIRRDAEGGPHFIVAGRYDDELWRTPDGWRIERRVLVTMWTEGNPRVVTGG